MGNKSKIKQTILGIDPGSTKIGFGVISHNGKNGQSEIPKVLGYGYIDLKSLKTKEMRLLQLHKDLKDILIKYKPEAVAVESIYFFKNMKTFTPVVESRGVIFLAVAQNKIKIFEYSPLQVKQTIAGYGRADKNFVQELVKRSLDMDKSITIKPDDASDALAIALCHFRNLSSLQCKE